MPCLTAAAITRSAIRRGSVSGQQLTACTVIPIASAVFVGDPKKSMAVFFRMRVLSMQKAGLSSMDTKACISIGVMGTTLAERMQEALNQSPDKTQAGLASACGISASAVSNWFTGKTKNLRGPNLYTAARYLGVSAEWLATGRGSLQIAEPKTDYLPGDQYCAVDQVSGEVSRSKTGQLSWEHEQPYLAQRFSRNWALALGLELERCKIFAAQDHSNAPWIMCGDAVLVQLGDTKILDSDDPTENCFLIQYGQFAKFRRLVPQHDGSMLLCALNPDKSSYKDERVANWTGLQIIGRVMWRGG